MKKTTLLLITVVGLLGIILSGCSPVENVDSQVPESNEQIENENVGTQEDPVNDTFEEDIVDENDSVEIGEII